MAALFPMFLTLSLKFHPLRVIVDLKSEWSNSFLSDVRYL